MLLSHKELCKLVSNKIVENVADLDQVNATSIDVRLGDTIMVERDWCDGQFEVLGAAHNEYRKRVVLDAINGYMLDPAEFILASTIEVFNLPRHISAEYKLKSSMARVGLEHLNAGWCDAGWHGSALTLELKNMNRHTSILIRPGMRIGQVVFFGHTAVSKVYSYAHRGRYNNDKKVTAAKA